MATLSILFLSKFVILEAVDIVFGDHVELGGFFLIVVLIIAMMAASAIVQVIYRRLGNKENPKWPVPLRLSLSTMPDPGGSYALGPAHLYPDVPGGLSR